MISRSFAIFEGRRETGGLHFFGRRTITFVAGVGAIADKGLAVSRDVHMRRTKIATPAYVLVVSAALALAGCGGGETEANNAATSQIDSNIMFEQLGNDASALEAAGNAAPMPPANEEAASDEDGGVAASGTTANNSDQPVLGETSGGDTGGNTVQE